MLRIKLIQRSLLFNPQQNAEKTSLPQVVVRSVSYRLHVKPHCARYYALLHLLHPSLGKSPLVPSIINLAKTTLTLQSDIVQPHHIGRHCTVS